MGQWFHKRDPDALTRPLAGRDIVRPDRVDLKPVLPQSSGSQADPHLSGERNPRRGTVLNLAQALYKYSTVITQRDAERLIQSSGFPPPRRQLFTGSDK